MRKIVRDATELRVFKPSNKGDSPDFTIPATDITQAEIPKTLGPLKDQAEFSILNYDGKYRRSPTKINGGERIEFWTQLGATAGVGVPSGIQRAETGPVHRRHTGIVRVPSGEVEANRSTLKIASEDYVGFFLANNVIEAGFENRNVAGTPESILNMILRRETPDIDRSRILPIDVNTTIAFNAEQMIKAVRRLLARGNVYMKSDHKSLVMEPLEGRPNTIPMLQEHDHSYPISFDMNDDQMANAIRLDGGEAVSEGDSQPVQSGWSTVTDENRLMYQLDMPKDNVPKIDVWTDPTRTLSGDGVVVRLQRNVGGSPAKISDESYDFARRTLASEFLQHDGFTTFIMPEHDIVNHDPFLIIESDGEGDSSGQDIGVDMSGNPTFYAYYPFPVSSRAMDQDSIETYRRREIQISDDSIHSLAEASEEVRAILRDRSKMEDTYEFPAESIRAHQLNPMDVVGIDDPAAGMGGDFVVTKRSDTFSGGDAVLSTDIRLSDIRDSGMGTAPPTTGTASTPTYIPRGESYTVSEGDTAVSPGGVTVAGELIVNGEFIANDG